ncbi:MAG: 2,3-bisphosphoglycerate-independent phosphoglycerate mutase [bacterium]|nr:2,3-bisphosphoglycerate-independent phosphoglycerate mutase [bacterium]MDZ4248133.1 2,3-bisphosphoglycerate-independent phosphoglycerate mutase [Patescibacteria group bacterium]
MLVVLDGWGYSTVFDGNAIAQADTTNFSRLWKDNPHALLQASGEAVGLPWGEMGNSEVGHLNIGAGRVVPQHLPRISAMISDGSFFDNEALLAACQHVNETGGTLHLAGLVSTGGVHAHLRHLIALLDLARRRDVKDVAIHLFTDGRDTAPTSARGFIKKLENEMKSKGIGRIATVSGRYYAMDRDNRWDRTRKAFEAIALAKGATAPDAAAIIDRSYEKGETDEFIEPTVITPGTIKPRPIEDRDSVIFFNYRPDRVRQLAEAMAHAQFDRFDRDGFSGPGYVVTFTEYEPNLPVHVAFHTKEIKDSLAKVLSDAGVRQCHIAETEKYPHATFFLNGGHEEPYPLEERFLIPSPQVATYDQQPDMGAKEIADGLLKKIEDPDYGFIMVNFANADMVGHTGDVEATVRAVSTVDRELGRIKQACADAGCFLIVTADHGNAEQMVNFTSGEADKEHTTNPVPFILYIPEAEQDSVTIGPDRLSFDQASRPTGLLGDVAPTILKLMGIPAPSGMDGYGLL